MNTYRIGSGRLTVYENGGCSLCGAANVPFAHIVCAGKLISVNKITFVGENPVNMRMHFDEAEVYVESKTENGYCVFKVTEASDCIEAFIWGPLFAPCTGECGEVVGVARNNGNIIGIQALNPKTVAGFPGELVGIHPMASEMLSRKGLRETAATCAALPLNEGAALQAFCRNRTFVTERDFFYASNALVLPVEGEDGLISGSAIALFECAEPKALDIISEIELGEGLPHTLVDGEWAKTARKANASYLIMDFTPDAIDKALDCAEEGGFGCLYHPGFFKNWGHFEVELEGGDYELKRLVEKASARGIDTGVHTLSNFMTTNDPYVTPVPHPNLLKMGETLLLSDISAIEKNIAIKDDTFFTRLSTLNAVQIGDELIQYQRIANLNGHICLADCERGAWGTTAQPHLAGQTAARLWDYDYRTLFPDISLQREFSRRLGELFRNTGLKRTSFDGLACDYTGHEGYAMALFVKDCYDIWGPEVISDASGLTHYTWHMHSYMNWGEPWYADMRNGMFEYRRSNQEYFKRNLFPPMMGWYTLRQATRKYESTTPDDINWMLSKAAGFKAGFAFNISQNALDGHGKAHEYLKTIKMWEELRLYGQLTDELLLEMQDPKSEWEIEPAKGGFLVYRVNIAAFECSPEGAQPGMPSGADWMIYNPNPSQKMVFRMRAGDERDRGEVSSLTFRAGENFIAFKTTLACGQYFIYDGGDTAEICDKNFNTIERVQGDGSELLLEHGISMLLFKCSFAGEEPPYPQVKVFMRGEPVFVPVDGNK